MKKIEGKQHSDKGISSRRIQPTITKEPARVLTSRELAKIISGILTGFIDWCGSDPVCDFLDHVAEHKEEYKTNFRNIEKILRPTPPGDEKGNGNG